MKNLLNSLRAFLEKIDHYRDELLFLFIKPFWPRKISPNQITYIRVMVGLALFVLLFWFDIKDKALIISLFCLGVLTDLFDGSVARGLNKVTEFGAMLDSTADRILVLPIAIYSLYISQKWLLLFFILTEVLNAIASIFYKSKEIYLESNIFGKTKMVLLCFVLIIILIVWPNKPSIFFIDIIWVSLIFSFLSMSTMLLELKNKGYIKSKLFTKQLNKHA